MPDAIITSTESTFGTISGTFAADQSTITGTVTGIVAGTLDGTVGVPGPGVPLGGTEGQIIVKQSSTDYDTAWADNSAETLTATVRNETGATLTKGTVVYITGAAGNKALVSKASASSEATSSKTFAILSADIPNNQNGTAVTVGLLKGLNTSALTEGGSLWLSTTAGQWTQTMPTAPNHAVFLGTVTRVHANQGTVEVRIQNGYELQELHNVKITSVSNGQVLKYDSAQSLWVNGTDVGVPAGGTAGQFLQKIDSTDYNTDWVTVNLSAYAVKANNLSDLTDAAIARTNLGLGTMATATAADYSTTAVANGLYYPLSSNPAGYITSAALSPYLLSSTAASTYQTLAGMSSYLTTSAAASTYYPLTNPSGYITSSALSPYLTSATAASTYQTIAGMSSYLTTATAASTYATILEPSVDGILTVDPSGINSATVQVNQDANNYIHLRPGDGQIAMVYGGSTKWFFNDTYLQFPGGTQQTVAYPGPSGFLLKADNLSGLANTATARTNLGLGTMATETASNYLTTSAAASTYLTQSSAASTYYLQTNPAGYITSSALSPYLTTATAASTYAPLASPALTGNPTAPTPATADNDTSIATTAFVKAQGYLTSAPVTSVAGRTGAVTLAVADVSGAAPLASPALTGTPTAPTATAGTNTTQIATTAFVTAAVPAAATLTDSRQLTNDTKAMSPLDVRWSLMTQDYIDIDRLNFTYTTTGTPQWNQVGSITTNSRLNATVASSVIGRPFGTSQVDQVSPFLFRNNWTSNINFNLKTHLSGRAGSFSLLTDATFNQAFYYGKVEGDAIGDLTRRGFGWRWTGGAGSRFVNLVVHNGTTQTTVASSFAVTQEVAFDWDLYSDGAGNVTLYINGTQVATSNAGPTSYQSAGTYAWWREEAWTTAAPSFGNHTSYFRGGRAAILNY